MTVCGETFIPLSCSPRQDDDSAATVEQPEGGVRVRAGGSTGDECVSDIAQLHSEDQTQTARLVSNKKLSRCEMR